MSASRLRLTDNARRVLRRRYLRRDAEGRVIETPDEMFRRVARAVAGAERAYGGDVSRAAEEFYQLMASGIFLPNSPTLMNAGRRPGMLSACFVLAVDDNIEGIFESVKQAALVQRAGGGTGFAFDRLRPRGDYIASSGGTTSGPISFWRVFSQATAAIQQGAFRRGANIGLMSVDHPDILKFITAKDRPGEFENFNISVKVGENFMAALASRPGEAHIVVNPRTQRRYAIPRGIDVASYSLDDLAAGDDGSAPRWTVGQVWRLIVRCAHATGEPGLCFIDRINADNPTPQLGRIEATNPCGEQPLLDYEACNLGSINLSKFVARGKFDEESFSRTVRTCVRFLDDVIDVSDFVVDAIAEISLGNRKIGLGVMGLADALMMMGTSYDSDEAIAFGRRVAELLAHKAASASEALAGQRGCFPNHSGSLWDARGRPMRNAAVTTVAPTGTISIIAGCSGGIEPVFALAFWRNVLGGERLLEVSPVFRSAVEARKLWSSQLAERLASGMPLAELKEIPDELRRVFVAAHDVPPARHVEMQAAFQARIDGAISKTINLPAGATVEDVENVYIQAHRSGCKGVTVYRDGCRQAQPMGWRRGDEDATVCPRCQAELPGPDRCCRCWRCGQAVCH